MNIEQLIDRAESGSHQDQSFLGLCYLYGTDFDIDYDKAFRWLSAAAKHGAPRTLANLGYMYLKGLGTDKDVSQAIRLLEQAAKQDEFIAQYELGHLYLLGEDIPYDFEQAFRWYTAIIANEHMKSEDTRDNVLEAKDFIFKQDDYVSKLMRSH